MTKLHLGCGQRYLEGYVNIDYPLSEHSTQSVSVADELANILELRYAASTIDEVRLHHVFEHVPRTQACALVAAWNSWLRDGGLVRIEVPDLGRTARALLSPFSSQHRRAVAERHIFGSHEAHWANHYEGYTSGLLSRLLESFGFRVTKVRRNAWKGTYNVDITATKVQVLTDGADVERRMKTYLGQFLVNQTPDELALLSVWLGDAKQQWEKSRAL